jgi:rare lipoprotein A
MMGPARIRHGGSASASAAKLRRSWLASLALLAALGAISGCAAERQFAPPEAAEVVGPTPRIGVASYYGRAFQGRVTASGERYDADKLTAAHRTLPFGTRLRVTNLANGRKVVVRVNDRGPNRIERIIDLSWQAAQKLQFGHQGLTRVRVEIL